MTKNGIAELQEWFHSQCNGQWEHSNGISIETLDNPGWKLTIDLANTKLERKIFAPVKTGIGKDAHPETPEWIFCKKEESSFNAYCGPRNLEQIIKVFLDWAES